MNTVIIILIIIIIILQENTDLMLQFTVFKIKFKTAVPPPSKTETKVLKEPRTRPIFPLTIDQIDSKRDMRVPTFCFKNSTNPLMLNISKIKKKM